MNDEPENTIPRKTNGRYCPKTVAALLADYHSSALTQKDWCERNAIKVATLCYWLQRQKEKRQGYSLIAVQSESVRASQHQIRVCINGVDLALENGDGGVALLVRLIRELGQ